MQTKILRTLKSKLSVWWPDQIVPLVLTFLIFLGLWWLYHLEILLLNRFVVAREPIKLQLRWDSILLGVTIYLKTAIDFAIYIGRLMKKHPGWKNRIIIEIGTALGNAVGTGLVLLVWDLFREVRVLMAIMIIFASLVLLRLAEDGLDHVKDVKGRYKFTLYGFVFWFEAILEKINRAIAPFTNLVLPHQDDPHVPDNALEEGHQYAGHAHGVELQEQKMPGAPNAGDAIEQLQGAGAQAGIRFWFTPKSQRLWLLAFTVPFLLGADDFAGYIPLFNVVNVYSFGIGVFLGHMLLNIFLFLNPKKTVEVVSHPVISFIGSLVFVALAGWGFVEAFKLLFLVG